MSDYTRQNDFSVKDALSSGDAAKLIKGSDMDAELDAIRTAVNSKADSPVPVASGGIGTTSLTDGGILLGSGTGAVTAMAALGAGVIVVGDGTTDPSTESLAGTVRSWTKAQRGALVTLSSSSNATAVDFSLSNNYSLTLAENSALTNPSNEVAGQCGSILIIQDGTGSRTLSYGTHYFFAGGTAPTLSTAANSVDRLDYFIQAADKVHCVLTKALATTS